MQYYTFPGTFLFDCEQDRQVARNTVSLWSLYEQPSEARAITNAIFRPSAQGANYLKPTFKSPGIRIWLGLFARWALNLDPHSEANGLLHYLKDRRDALKAETDRLRAELGRAKTQLKQARQQQRTGPEATDPLLGRHPGAETVDE
jgi:hypothetical protein